MKNADPCDVTIVLDGDPTGPYRARPIEAYWPSMGHHSHDDLIMARGLQKIQKYIFMCFLFIMQSSYHGSEDGTAFESEEGWYKQ